MKALNKLFTLDLRSLALSRFCLGLLCLITFFNFFHSSFLFGILGISASVFLMIGCRTKLNTAILCLLLLSFKIRFPDLNNQEIYFLEILLFFSFFLPTNSFYSFDAVLSEFKNRKYASIHFESFIWIIQVLSILLLLFLEKWTPPRYLFFILCTPLIPAFFWQLKCFRKELPSPFILYFDPDCNFCRKSCFLIKEFLFIPELLIYSGGNDPEVLKIMVTKKSWVLKNNGNVFIQGKVFSELLYQSSFFLFRWLGVIYSFLPLNFIYIFVSKKRKYFGVLLNSIGFEKIK